MKKWTFMLLALLAAFSLTACGGESDAEQNAAGNAESNAAENISFAYWGAQSEADAIKLVIEDFQANHPEIKVESQWIQQDYLTKIQTMIAGGTSPDVMLISGGDLPGFVNAFEELQVDSSVFSSASLVDAMSVDGKTYAVPYIIKPKVMAINVDLFEQNGIPLPSKTEPMTVEEFDAIAKKIASGEGASKIYGSEPLWLGNWIYAFGGRYYTEDLSRSALDTPEAIAAGEYIVSTKRIGIVPGDSERQGQDMMNWYLAGRIGMFTDFGPWYIPQMAETEGFNWDLVPFPGNGGSKEVNGLALSKNSKSPEAAKTFIDYLTQNEIAQKLIGGNKSAYGVPVLTSATDAFEQIIPDKNLGAFLYAAEHQHIQEAQKRTNEINNEMKALEDLTPIGIGSSEVKDIFPQVAERVTQIIQQ